jgi:hypothetical protein
MIRPGCVKKCGANPQSSSILSVSIANSQDVYKIRGNGLTRVAPEFAAEASAIPMNAILGRKSLSSAQKVLMRVIFFRVSLWVVWHFIPA